MTYRIETPARFLRQARKFFRQHPELRERFAVLLEALRQDPFQPQLRLHPLAGELDGLHAVSLTYAYRVTLVLEVTEQAITLIDIGDHDEVYR
ncbi:MAG TPA: hypothetical protein VFW96_16810 [Thermomicrobiales bacterium]|nr:hypothetical protein [Thermomicrobiales bacterium]